MSSLLIEHSLCTLLVRNYDYIALLAWAWEQLAGVGVIFPRTSCHNDCFCNCLILFIFLNVEAPTCFLVVFSPHLQEHIVASQLHWTREAKIIQTVFLLHPGFSNATNTVDSRLRECLVAGRRIATTKLFIEHCRSCP